MKIILILYLDYPNINLGNIGSNKVQIFKILFKIIGKVGECSPVVLSRFFPVDNNGVDIFAYLENGLVCKIPRMDSM